MDTKDYYAIKILIEKEEIAKWWKYEKSFFDKIEENDINNISHCLRMKEKIKFVKNDIKYYGFFLKC